MKGKMIYAVLVASLALGINSLAARELAEGEWYVRLILTSETGGLEDSYNTFGQFADALPQFDSYDLPELGQTWAGTYLSVIFYRPDWETLLESEEGVWDLGWEDFNTDYHPVSLVSPIGGCDLIPATETGDQWAFEVRSDDTGRALTLTWEGSDAANLDRMVLVDLQENVTVPAIIDGVPQEYAFVMNGAVRAFAWQLLSDQQYEEFVTSGEVGADTAASRAIAEPLSFSATSASAVTAEEANTTGDQTSKSGWLPLGWSPGQWNGAARPVPEGLPDDPFGD